LEDRLTPAPFTVTTAMDNGNNANPTAGSLREAVTKVNAGMNDGINFNLAAGAAIDLPAPLPDVTRDVEIQGPGAANLTVRRGAAAPFRLFTIATNGTVLVAGLRLADGQAPQVANQPARGGAILITTGTLRVNASVFRCSLRRWEWRQGRRRRGRRRGQQQRRLARHVRGGCPE
jgi:hypothetical protein